MHSDNSYRVDWAEKHQNMPQNSPLTCNTYSTCIIVHKEGLQQQVMHMKIQGTHVLVGNATLRIRNDYRQKRSHLRAVAITTGTTAERQRINDETSALVSCLVKQRQRKRCLSQWSRPSKSYARLQMLTSSEQVDGS